MSGHGRFARLVLAIAGAAALAAGCGPDDAPAMPGYLADVKPLMGARCVRCHGAGGTLNDDPGNTSTVNKGAPLHGYFDRLEDQGTCTAADGTGNDVCKRGLLYYVTAGAPTFTLFIRATGELRMPPPPAPELTDREHAILERWIVNPQP
jgi:hypothetical protein